MDSYTDGLSGVWVAVADAISDEGIYMEDEHIRSLAYAVVRAYREYTDNLTEEERDGA